MDRQDRCAQNRSGLACLAAFVRPGIGVDPGRICAARGCRPRAQSYTSDSSERNELAVGGAGATTCGFFRNTASFSFLPI